MPRPPTRHALERTLCATAPIGVAARTDAAVACFAALSDSPGAPLRHPQAGCRRRWQHRCRRPGQSRPAASPVADARNGNAAADTCAALARRAVWPRVRTGRLRRHCGCRPDRL